MGSNESVSKKVVVQPLYFVNLLTCVQESASLSEKREWRLLPQQAVQLWLTRRQLSPSAATFVDAGSRRAPPPHDSRHVDKILSLL